MTISLQKPIQHTISDNFGLKTGGGENILSPPHSEKWGGDRPPCPPGCYAYGHFLLQLKIALRNYEAIAEYPMHMQELISRRAWFEG